MPKKRKYSSEALKQAIGFVQEAKCSARHAAKLFGVPRSSIQYKIDHPEARGKSGPCPILTEAEEQDLCNFIISLAERGFPRKKEDIQTSVQNYLKEHPRENPFRDNRPGDGWFHAFLKRHPEISIRTSEGVTNASACVSEQDIRKWFKEIQEYINDVPLTDAIKDPTRVYNADETGFNICPKSGKVLAKRGAKNVYEIEKAPIKENITVMFAFSASGHACKPMVIYPYKRIPDKIAESVPTSWGIGRSDTGWMTAAVFYEYISSVFYPDLVNNSVQFPVILFVDGHKTHLTLEVSELCKSLQIHLIALYPNATRILQPADVAAFRPIKTGWKKRLRQWYADNNYDISVTKLTFAPLLKHVLDEIAQENTLVNGFRITGLFPFDANNVDYSKCLASKDNKATEKYISNADVDESYVMSYNDFCEIAGHNVISKCESTVNETDYFNDEYFGVVFKLWKRFHQLKKLDQPSEEIQNYPSTPKITEGTTAKEQLKEIISDKKQVEIYSIESKFNENEASIENSKENKHSNEFILDEQTGELKQIFNRPEIIERIEENMNSKMQKINDSIKTGQDTNKKEDVGKSGTVSESSITSTIVDNPEVNGSQVLQAPEPKSSNKKITVISNQSLDEYLKKKFWPESPKRKGKRNIERVPFAMTSDSYIELIKNKKQKKEQDQIDKEKRKQIRENKKNKENSVKPKKSITKTSQKQTHKLESKKKIKVETITSENVDIEDPDTYNINYNDLSQIQPKNTSSVIDVCNSCSGYITKKNIRCDNCLKTFHPQCIPSFHRVHIPVDECDGFMCHICYKESNSDSDNDISLLNFLKDEAKKQGF